MACSEDITKLSGELMTLEMQLVEQLEVRGAPAPPGSSRGLVLLLPARQSCPLSMRSPLTPSALAAAGRAHASGSPHPPWKGQSLGRGF